MSRTEQTAVIREKFSSATRPEDVAVLLEISWAKLRYLLYRMPKGQRYRLFDIPKKSGGKRWISAPRFEIKELQQRLNDLLKLIYEPRLSTHGFALDRSIVTNAQPHARARFVFNVDLADFFPSIHFGRVRGLFLKKPFECKPAVATVIAQLCCHDGKLPQGAPTSPIISNLICGKMDVDLQRLARDNACVYTRYADDITFSSNRRAFPPSIARSDEMTGKIQVGSALLAIIQEHSFSINEAKVRLQRENRRQIVTGLKVNQLPNVSRKLLSQVRAMLHAWKKFGIQGAENEYRAKYERKHWAGRFGRPMFKDVLKGKIEFVGMVRGKKSPVFLRLGRELRSLDPGLVKGWDLDSLQEKIQAALCVLEGDNSQGSGFFLKNVGLVTCQHVLQPSLKVFKRENTKKRYKTYVLKENRDIDLAVLKTRLEPVNHLEFVDRILKIGEQVYLCGFPKFDGWNAEVRVVAQIIGLRKHMGFVRYLLDKPIVTGNSGGPVIDMSGNVVGVAATGTNDMTQANPDEQFGVVPIGYLSKLDGSKDLKRRPKEKISIP